MKLAISTLMLCCMCTFAALAQTNYAIKGSVGDATSNVKLAGATIMVLNQKDSIMRAFTWAGNTGEFTIDNLPKGKFLLLMTYPNYADYVEKFNLDSANKVHDFGYVDMTLTAKLLKDVIVKGQVDAIKVKGDTTEYNAKAFKVQPNATVEDLLKQFPGFQVDKNGKITAQGKTVQKVLVDGEEFFGDDPTLVTRNLRADMVDKAQLYEKKSDQAAFTGIDDGKTTTTLNLKLKQDKKNGLFGKVSAGVGTDGYYEGQLQFNRFKANEKFSVYGTTANDGKTGIGFEDASQLGVSNDNVQFGDDGSMMFYYGGGDALDSFSGTYNNQGLPKATSGGAHYDSKWNGDKESINANYKIGQIDVRGNTVSTSQQTLPSGINNTNSNQDFDNFAYRQKLDLTYQIKLDTAQTLKFTGSATDKTFHVINDFSTQTSSDSAGIVKPLNDNTRHVDNRGDEKILAVTGLYTKKFKKVGRTLSWFVSENYDKKTTKGYLYSKTDTYAIDTLTGKSVATPLIVDQYKPTTSTTQTLRSNLTYTEPITKKLSIMFNYAFGINNAQSNNMAFDKSGTGDYNVLDTAYSNNYKFNQMDNQVGAIFNYKYKKYTINFGTKVADDNYKQTNEYTGDVMTRNFINWYPQAMFQYKIGPQTNFAINYRGNTTQPSLQQIQPLLTNTDPLNITLGNPDLKPSFHNDIYFWYNSYHVISGLSYYMNGGIYNTINEIVNKTTTASDGANTIQYVNLTGHSPFNFYFYGSVNQRIKALADINIGFNVNANGGTNYSFSNGLLSKGTNNNYSGSISLNKSVEKKFDLGVDAGPTYTFSTMSLQPNVNNNAGGFHTSGWGNLFLPLKFGISSDVNYNYTAATQAFHAEYRTIWNASLFKTFLKDDKLKISASANDILNQNKNYSRNQYANFTTQSNTTGIQRYFMLSVSWNFTKFGTTTQAQEPVK